MNKPLIAFVLGASAVAAADPTSPAASPAAAAPATSPWGSSPNVAAYAPPAVSHESHAHRGITLEVSMFGGTTSRDTSAFGGGFGIGLWITEPVSLMFRATRIGEFGFIGASVQFAPKTANFWAGAGAGQLIESYMDYDGYSNHHDGTGGFARLGYNMVRGDAHALYLSGELQAGSVADRTRVVGVVALGYQLL